MLKDIKDTVVSGLKDTAEITQLGFEEAKDAVKHQVRKEVIAEKVDNLKEDYTHIKDEIKHKFKN